jgi:hypothetical protein
MTLRARRDASPRYSKRMRYAFFHHSLRHGQWGLEWPVVQSNATCFLIGPERRAGEHTPIVYRPILTTSAIVRSVPGTTPIARVSPPSQTQRRSSTTSRRAPLLRVRVIAGSPLATSRHSWTLPYGQASETRKMCGYGTLLDRKVHFA